LAVTDEPVIWFVSSPFHDYAGGESQDLNRAIVQCMAGIQAAKTKEAA
jgi:hypothetical protein